MRSLSTLAVGDAISHQFQRRLSECYLAGVMTLCGVALMLGPTFDLPPYVVIAQMASQPVWAWMMLAIGSARLGALVVNGSRPRESAYLRFTLAFAAALVWSGILWGFWSFHTPLLIGPFLLLAVLVEFVTIFRAAQDARLADEGGGAGDGPG